MNLSRIFIERPVATTVLVAAIVFFGWLGFPHAAGQRSAERRFPDDLGDRASCPARTRR